MRKLHLLLGFIFVLNTSGVFSQYLSFNEGIKKTDEAETIPERYFFNGESYFVEITYNFSGANISETEVEGEKYNFLHIDGFAKMGQVGAPALPAHNEIIAMPENSTGKVIILSSEYMEYEGFNIHPALKPAIDTEGAPSPEFEKDEKIYSSDEFFPQNIVEVTDVLMSRETPLAVTQVRPVQFNPVTGKIRVYTKIEYRLEFIGGKKSFSSISENNSLVYTNLLKRNVINSESIPDGIPYSEFGSKSVAKNYIIITHVQYLSNANDLATWKRQLGYSVEVVSRSSWTAAQVKDSIHTRYNSWTPKPDYFVIIGDHTGSYAVPGEIHNAPYAPPYNGPFATDLYYACMGGTGDWVPDMAHGRISVSSSSEAGVIVNKIINYEETPVNDATFYQNGLNCAQYQDTDNNDGYADRRFCHTSEDIRDYMINNQSYTVERVYEKSSTWPVNDLHYNNGQFSTGQLLPSELRSGSFNWSGGASDITSAINAGKFYVFHRDHGYVGGSGWAHPYYTTTSMNSLSNGSMLPVIFSMNCHTGEFQLSNCFAEKFVRMENKGAIGVVAAAFFSLSGNNDGMSIGMVDAIWSDPGLYPVFGTGGTGNNYTIGVGNNIYTMGDVVNQGLHAMLQNWNGGSTNNKYSHELFHWFGDPAMKIWTTNPNTNPITATHSSFIDCSGTSFSISNSTPGAIATLVYDGELLGETVIDASGNGTINYTITAAGSVALLTISKHNQKPYVAILNITPCGITTAEFTTDDVCPVTGQTVTFTDQSYNYPTSWSWSFNPATITYVGGTSSSSQNPQLTFNATGFYTVTLTAANANGNDSEIKTNYIRTTGVITTFHYTQNFDTWTTSSPGQNCTNDGTVNLEESWINVTGDDIDWDIYSGATPSGSTGPSSDHTSGTGKYLYTEASNCFSHTGKIISPVFDLTSLLNATLTFWYHMYGAYMGTMYVQVSTDGGTTWSSNVWSKTGDQGNSWQQATVSLDPYLSFSNFVIRFTGTTDNWSSDMAIDDFAVDGTPGDLWTGNTSTDWGTAGNWKDGSVPTNIINVAIPASAPNWPIFTGDFALGTQCNDISIPGASEFVVSGDLTIGSGRTLTVDANATIYVGGDWTNNGTFTPGTGTVEFNGTNPSTINVQPASPVYLIDDDFTTWPGNWNGDIAGGNGQFDQQASNVAEGTSPEARFTCEITTGTRRMFHNAVNTSGLTSLTLDFRHNVDDWGSAGYTVKVQYSTDGTNWFDSDWSVSPTGNIAATPVSTVLTSASHAVGSATYYISFTITGNLGNINYWYIDDVKLHYTSLPVETFYNLTISKNNAEATTNGNIDVDNELTIQSGTFTIATGDIVNVE